MDVVHFFRRPGEGCFSIERVFEDVRKALPEHVVSHVATAHFPSRGIWPRFYNTIEAAFRQGDVNHITGDVHYLALLLRKKKTLLTIHDCVSLERLSGWRRRLLFFFWYWLPARRSAMISVISESTRRELLKYVDCPEGKIRVVHDPVSALYRPSPAKFRPDHPVILHVGMTPNKNLLRVAEALRGISCHLRIIGRLSVEQGKALENGGLEYSSVHGISDHEIVREYQQCDMLLFASTYEGFGLPIVEAQATGRPVVTSNILSMPEVGGDAACYVDPLNTASIREGVIRVINDVEFREQLVEAGYRNVERFRPERIAAQYMDLYQELADAGSPA